MNANELADAMEIRASIRRKATSRKSVQENANDRLADQLDQAATMLRQQQAEIEELEKENTDLRYLIATKLEQQDGISLNSMAHPITNTPEPSYEIDPDKLETIEIDLPSPEPVAWMIQYKDRHKFVFEKPTYSEHILACEPLYTHPVKELTDEEILIVWTSSNFVRYTENGHIDEIFFNKFARAILRKAQEK